MVINTNLLDDFPAPICRTGVYGAVNYCNRAWLEFTGQPLEGQMGDGWTEGIHPEDRDGCLAVYTRSVAEGKPFENEYRLRRWDGEYRWVLDIGQPYYDSEHDYCGYVRVCHDNTDRKLNSASLKSLTPRPTGRNGSSTYSLHPGVRNEIGPALTALVIHLALLQSELPRGAGDAQQHLKSALELVQVAVEALSDPANAPDRPTAEVTGLNLALMSYCDEATARYSIPINYSGVEIPRLNKPASMAMIRLLQEGLAGAHDFAQASRICVALNYTGRQVRLVIEDNGNGCNLVPCEQEPQPGENTTGFAAIQEIFQDLGGTLETEFHPGKGGSIIGVLPV